MPKSPTKRSATRSVVATRSSRRIAERGTPNFIRAPPRIVHTYSRKSLRKHQPPCQEPSLLSLDSDCSLPTVEELLASIGKSLPPSAIDKINTYFRKLSKLVSREGDKEARFSLETNAFRETLEGLYSEITEKVKVKSNQLAEVAMIFERESRCPICAACIYNPVILVNCGHTFCASCIREHFHESLRKKLANFCKEKSIYVTLSPSTTLVQMQELSRIITAYAGDVSKIFSYQCPQCRGCVTKPPILVYQFRSLVSEARTALSEYMNDTDGNPSDEVPVAFFDGFFI